MNTAPSRGAIATVLCVAFSGFLMGFDTSLFTGAVVFVETEFALNKLELGWAVTSHTLAATLSIFLAGPLADRFGRRTVLRVAALVFGASALLAMFAPNFVLLITARMLSGLGVGAVLVAAPMYIAEISPPAWRGRLVSFNQLFIVLGISAAFASNYVIHHLGAPEAPGNWRWMLGVGVLPPLLYVVALFSVPESPRWLAMHGRLDAARRILARAHGPEFAAAELAELRASLAGGGPRSEASLRELFVPGMRGVLVIGVIVGVLQQITGINSVLAYATVIFERAGAGADASFMQTVYVGLVNLVFTVVAMLLIDRVGRRPLLIYGTAGIAACMLLTAYGFHAAAGAMSPVLVLAGMLGFIASFALSLGPGMWVLLSEIFPNRVRGLAISFVGLVNSAVCFVVQLIFPWQVQAIGDSQTFLIYGLFGIVGVALMFRLLPETRGRSLEELESDLVQRR